MHQAGSSASSGRRRTTESPGLSSDALPGRDGLRETSGGCVCGHAGVTLRAPVRPTSERIAIPPICFGYVADHITKDTSTCARKPKCSARGGRTHRGQLVSKRSMRRNDRPKDDRQRPQPRSCWFARTLVLVLLRRCRSSYRVGVKIGMDRFVADLSPTDLSTPFTRVFGIRATGLPNDLGRRACLDRCKTTTRPPTTGTSMQGIPPCSPGTSRPTSVRPRPSSRTCRMTLRRRGC
jgi:hypothetical protein